MSMFHFMYTKAFCFVVVICVFLANARVVKVFLPFGEKSIWAPGQEGHMILLSATLPLRRPAKEAHQKILRHFSLVVLVVHDLHQSKYLNTLFFCTFITYYPSGDVRVFIPRRAHSLWEGA